MRGFLSKYRTISIELRPDVLIKWLATAFLIIGAVLTSGNWYYPWNVVFFLLGNLAWALVGFMWRETSLIVLNVGITLIYVVGMLVKYWS